MGLACCKAYYANIHIHSNHRYGKSYRAVTRLQAACTYTTSRCPAFLQGLVPSHPPYIHILDSRTLLLTCSIMLILLLLSTVLWGLC